MSIVLIVLLVLIACGGPWYGGLGVPWFVPTILWVLLLVWLLRGHV